MSFGKVLIANRGDKRRTAALAAETHIGKADVKRSHIAGGAKRQAIEPRS